MRDESKKARRPNPKESALVKQCSLLTDEAIKQVLIEITRTVGQLHPGMIPPVLSEIGVKLILNGMCLDHNMPEALKPVGLINGQQSQEVMLEHVLESIRKVAADHSLALSYRVGRTS